MSTLFDNEYIVKQQYQDASNLDARIQLHARFSTNPQDWQAWIFDQFDLPAECRILELGCGMANLWLENIDRVPQGWDITLSDFSAGMLQSAQKNLAAYPGRFKFRVIDAHAIPFEDERFDAVIANHMLYHVRDRTSAFSDIRRILKPGGVLYASTVSRYHMRDLYLLARRFDSNIRFGADEISFTLENGRYEMESWFDDIEIRHFQDSLAITEVQPIIAYLMSSPLNAKSLIGGSHLEDFTRFLQKEMESQGGVIRVAKGAGLFIARK